MKRLARPLVGTVLLPLSMSQWPASSQSSAGRRPPALPRQHSTGRAAMATSTHDDASAAARSHRSARGGCALLPTYRVEMESWSESDAPPLGAVSTTGFLFLGVGGMPARDRDEMPTHRGPLGSIPRVQLRSLLFYSLPRPPPRVSPRFLPSESQKGLTAPPPPTRPHHTTPHKHIRVSESTQEDEMNHAPMPSFFSSIF